LAYIKILGADPVNTVFALVRSLGAAKQLTDFVATHQRKNVHVLEADIADSKAIQNAAETVRKVTGSKLDVLVNNGALLYHERDALTLDAYEDADLLDGDMTRFFKVNVLGVIHTINAFLPLLRAGDMKKCILITSTVGTPKFTAFANYSYAPGYNMSKAALNLACAKYAAQYKSEGIVFLCITPGLVKTIPDLKRKLQRSTRRQRSNSERSSRRSKAQSPPSSQHATNWT